jgi:hypothetical protein
MPGTTGLNIKSRPHLVMPAKAGIHDFPSTKQNHLLFLKKRSKKTFASQARAAPPPKPHAQPVIARLSMFNRPQQ